jgi:hypothetical protein
MLDTPAERNALLASLLGHHSGFITRQARGDEDDLQDLLLKLLGSSPDFLMPELAGYELGQLDAKIEAVKDKLARSSEGSQRHKDLLAQLGKLHQERDHIAGGPWVRIVLYHKAIDRYRTEANRARIVREHAPELAGMYRSGVGPSAEWVVMRKLEHEDILRRIRSLPKSLAPVAALRYAGYDHGEIAGILGISADAVWKRAQRIRSPKIRAIFGLA